MRRFRFSIRTLVFAVAAIAVGLGILVSYEPFQRGMLHKRLAWAGVLAADTPMDSPLNKFWTSNHQIMIDVDGKTRLDDVRALLPRPKIIFMTVQGKSVPKNWAESLSRFDNVRSVTFLEANLSDDDIAVLKDMQGIEALILDGSDVSDASIPVLKSMLTLRQLSLSGTQVSDAGVEELVAAGIMVRTPNGEFRDPEKLRLGNWRHSD